MSERCHGRTEVSDPSTAPAVADVVLVGGPGTRGSAILEHLARTDPATPTHPRRPAGPRRVTCLADGARLEVEWLVDTGRPPASASGEVVPIERVLAARDPNVVAVLLDATTLELSLYLAVSLADTGHPLVLVLDRADEAEAAGITVDDRRLAAAFGAPVVRTGDGTGNGVDGLRRALLAACRASGSPDRGVREVARLPSAEGTDAAMREVERRYARAHHLAAAVQRAPAPAWSRAERVDDLVTHRWVGIVLLLGAMWLVFALVTAGAGPLIRAVEAAIDGPVRSAGERLLGAVGLGGGWVEGLVLDGALAGVGAVLAFVPVLALLYLALGALEDSGYMARAAYLVDRAMAPIGLSGRSVLPLLVGFGCNVPAVAATSVLGRRRERILTALLVPFVSCAARLPVYLLLASALLPRLRGTAVFGMYVLSVAVVLGLGRVLDRVVLPGERGPAALVELPPYRRPMLRLLVRSAAGRVGDFIRGAGTVILAAAIAVWLLLAVPLGGGGSFGDAPLEDSAFAATSRTLAPVLAPAGLGSWEVAGTLLTGVLAKEVMVATLAQVYDVPEAGGGEDPAGADAVAEGGMAGVGELAGAAAGGPRPGLSERVQAGLDRSSGGHGALAALALMVLVLLYIPCVATLAAIRQQVGTRWAAVSAGLSLGLGWVAATAVFQVGRLVAPLVGGG